MINLKDEKIKHICPYCKSPVTFLSKQIQNEESIKCVNCDKKFNLIDKNASTKKVMNDVNNSVKNIKRAIKNFGK